MIMSGNPLAARRDSHRYTAWRNPVNRWRTEGGRVGNRASPPRLRLGDLACGQGPAVSGGVEPLSELSSGAGSDGASPPPVAALPLDPPPGWPATAGPVVIPAAARAAAACWPAGTAAVAAPESTAAGLSAPEPRPGAPGAPGAPADLSSPGPPNAAVTAFRAVVTS